MAPEQDKASGLQVALGSVGCLVFVVLAAFLLIAALTIVFDNPLLWLGFAAVCIVLAGGRTGRRRSLKR